MQSSHRSGSVLLTASPLPQQTRLSSGHTCTVPFWCLCSSGLLLYLHFSTLYPLSKSTSNISPPQSFARSFYSMEILSTVYSRNALSHGYSSPDRIIKRLNYFYWIVNFLKTRTTSLNIPTVLAQCLTRVSANS